MGVYIAKRLAWSCVSILALTLASYVIFFQIPADPARFLVRNQFPTQEQLDEANRKLGTDKPLYEQYGLFLWRLAHFDLGVSYAGFDTRNERTVSEEIRAAAPITVSVLVGGAILVAEPGRRPGVRLARPAHPSHLARERLRAPRAR